MEADHSKVAQQSTGVEHTIAVAVDNSYYRAFQVVETIRQAAKMAKLLAYYGEQSIITRMPRGYGIWRLDTTLSSEILSTRPDQTSL